MDFKWIYTKLNKWQILDILEPSKEFQLLCHYDDALVKNLPVEKTIVIVIEPDKNVHNNANVLTAIMVNLITMMTSSIQECKLKLVHDLF